MKDSMQGLVDLVDKLSLRVGGTRRRCFTNAGSRKATMHDHPDAINKPLTRMGGNVRGEQSDEEESYEVLLRRDRESYHTPREV